MRKLLQIVLMSVVIAFSQVPQNVWATSITEDFESYPYPHWALKASGTTWNNLKIYTEDMNIVFIDISTEGAGTGNGAKCVSANANSSSSWLAFEEKDGKVFSLSSLTLGNPNTTFGSQYLTVEGYLDGNLVKTRSDVANWSTTTPVTTAFAGWDNLDYIKIIEPNMNSGDITYISAYLDDIVLTNLQANSAPTDLSLSSSAINENVGANSTIGTLSSTDPDSGNTFTYSLVSGAGSTDNASFNISGDSLRITSSPDYETKNSYTVRIRTTDQGSLLFEKAFTITINDLSDVNSAPTDLALSSSAINENVAANTAVGTFSSTDPDVANTFTYTLIAGAGSTDNASFNISGSSLRITSSPDYETKNSYTVRVRTTDQGGLYYEKAFTVTINDVSEGSITLSVAVPANATYTVGQTLNFTVTYNENIMVDTIGGTPSIPVTLATGTVNAGYLNGSGTQNLVFRYTVTDGNNDPDGVSVGSAIALNGGTLKNAGAVDADLNLNSVASTVNVRVDALAPTATITAGTTAGGDALVGVSEKTAGFDVVARSSEGNGTLYVVPSGTAKNMGAITGAAIGSAASAGANSDTTIAIVANNPGVINGFVYKVYAVDASGNISAISGVAFTADFSGPTLTAGAVNRTSDTAGTVKFTSNEAGKYYYEIVADGAAAPSIDTGGAGTDCTTTEETITNPIGLTAGAKDFYIVVKDAANNVSSAIKIDIAGHIEPDSAAPTLTAGAVNRTSDTAGTVKFTSNEAGKYYYEIVADGAAAPSIDTNGAGTDCTTAETTITNPAGLTAGAKDIYIVVKDAAGNVSGAIKIDIAAHIEPDTTAPTLTAGTVNRTSDTAGTVTFTSNEAGKYYYALVADGAAAPGVDTSGAGTDCTTAEATITNPTGLTAGAKDLYIVVKDAANNVSSAIKMDIAAYVAPSGGSSSGGGGGGSSAPVVPSQTPVTIIVNGDGISAGTSKDTVSDGTTTTTITVDEQKLEQKLDQSGSGAVVTVPANTDSGTVIGELNGQMVKNMETHQAVLEIKNNTATYTLPAGQINIDAVSQQFGTSVSLKDIKVQIEIVKTNQETATLAESAAVKGEFTIVAPPVEFNVRCTYAGKTVAVSQFNAYVERTVAIPVGVDPAKITTGVIVDADGTVRHVPTQIIIVNGKYYAKINSLTNSTYSVVYNPVSFKDVETHWAKASVNNMGSRMVVSGAGNGQYEPDRGITRAEFAAIVVRALGLKPGTGTNSFGDVATADWYCKSIETASAYGIITGYDKTTFGPNEKITREQAMAMIARTLKITGLKATVEAGEAETLLAGYADSPLSSAWAQEGTATCIKTGIVSGKAPGVLAPQDEITRAEVAVIIERLLKKSGLI